MPEFTKTDEAIFAAAIEMSPGERAAYLDNVCGTDAALRERIEGLLRSHDQAGSFLHNKPVELVATVDGGPLTEAAGTIIGRYKLLQPIGEGGFGVVYMAEQKEPVRRKVALKIIKLGMNSKEVSARFEAERQALALMDHPNIAKVLDAGTTETGRPYFVMELVKGVPIGEFCDKNQLPLRERLEIFTAVCQAVQHAHLKGIIHRDIKPSNVLVTLHDGRPVPKVIDFGVAKALNQELTEKTLFTAFGHMIGTPQYMSPEQAEMSGLDVDTRSDVYSLGVLLYELLTGTTPLEAQKLRKAGYAEMQRMIREEESPRPSVRVSTLGENLSIIAKDRHCEPGSLQQLLRGDLDWIVMKALEKDRSRRYETASAFAADVRRHLSDEVVEARPPSAAYRFSKMARRNKAAMTTAGLVAATLLLGVLVSAWQAVRATRAEEAALAAEAMALDARDQETTHRQAAEEERQAALAAGAGAKKSEQLAAASAARAKDQEQFAKEQEQIALAQAKILKVRLYASHIASAQREWQSNNVPLLYHYLEQCSPDIRGWEHDYLYTLANPSQHTLLGHTHIVHSVAFSPDGKRLASASLDKTVKLWDTASADEILTLKGHTAAVWSVAFSADGKRLASASADKTVKLWDAASGQEILTLEGHTGDVRSVAFSADGKRLASASADKTVKLWNAASGQKVLILEGHTGGVQSVAFSPDGKRLASASADKTVKLWDVAGGQEVLTLEGHTAVVHSVAFSPDGKRLASGSKDTVTLWDVASGREVTTLRGHTNSVYAVAFSPDGKRLASGSRGTVKLWDAASSDEVPTLRGLASHVYSMAFSPDGKRLATAAGGVQASEGNNIVRLWDATSGQEVLTLKGHTAQVYRVAFSPDGKLVASASGDTTIKLWDAASGQEIATLKGHTTSVSSVAFSPDGRRLASGSSPGQGRSLADEFALLVAGNKGLLSDSGDKTVRLWDAASGEEILTLKVGSRSVRSVAFSPDGKRLASAAHDGTVNLWDAASGQEILKLTIKGPLPAANAWRMAFRPDGNRLVSASGHNDGTVTLWDADSGRVILLKGHIRQVNSVAFSPDGKRLASGSLKDTVKLWDVASGQEVLTLKGHSGYINNLAFSPDGKRLAIASNDGTIKILDASKSMKEAAQK